MAIIALVYIVGWTLLLVGFIGLPMLLIMFCVPGWRGALLRHPRKTSVLSLVCISVVGVTLYQVITSYHDNQRRHPKLAHAFQVEGLALPAGATLHLETPEPLDERGRLSAHAAASLTEAEFVAPHTVAGLSVTTLRFRGSEVEMKLAGDQLVQGWSCKAGSRLTMNFEVPARLQPDLWQFNRCELVAGTQVAGVVWPADSQVYRLDTGYVLSHWGQAEAMSINGLALKNVEVRLNVQRQLLNWKAQLTQPMTLGEWQYPAGMRVGQSTPHTLVFRSDRYYAGRNVRTGETLEVEHSIQQRMTDGIVLWIKPDAELKASDW
ncbi:hypothetical protein [Pseudomonas botevensis]|uniref:hypothetical protein n=1 Tax=Pseudomonas botevensis TaxID=2842352 RepID=UPI001C3D8BFC|nr:hypothetical protein [Pseudomonas botevensis]MBV4472937.1 hypothetical protein [Pseudomonas botevensis]